MTRADTTLVMAAEQYLVITDGRATDDPESVIVATARRLDSLNAPLTQIGIQLYVFTSLCATWRQLEDCTD
jgi:hypothetical protein